MTRTIARLYDSSATAQEAVRSLESAGFAHDAITYMGSAGEDRTMPVEANTTTGTTATGTTPHSTADATPTETGAATGASLGTVVGGGAGLLAGIGALAIPGVGPLVAAGWLIATLTGAGVGAAAGGLIGALTSAGLGEDHATRYSEGVRRGGHLVAVRTDDARADEAERILERHGPIDMATREQEWRSGGWEPGDVSRNPQPVGHNPVTPPHGANDPDVRRPGDVA
ncbi:hypothetical protein [Falsiroseomonas selenitidurans]|uniref:General stress protein 17M-like domain-containing protein n=1 Tax=Falsiroseomonas selenitidurans TaxID=2716335 RepID=A0ABX1E4Z4_9PROT|nr:hypothetical protein [Falsiroseomonas selenitidurans]NKC29995.1 hypothetical protein [Falsiroseomonas selenitidurans]